MSVRRLDPVQPAHFSFTPKNLSAAKAAIKKFPKGKQASAVIQLLWLAQEQEGWVSRPALECVGKMLDMAFIRVLEVATFYTMFQLSPVGRKAHIQVCGTTPCMLRGAEDLLDLCRRKIHAEPHHLNADGSLSWEEVECIGACVNAPVIQMLRDTYEDLSAESLDRIIDDFVAGREVKPGPQNSRKFSMAITGPTSLTDKSLYTKQRYFKRQEAPPPPPPVPATPAAAAAPPVAKPPVVADKPAGPELIAKPRGQADDLKLIWGIGPKLEQVLNKTGVWHFSQIALWSKADSAHMDALLTGFHGRALRDEWVKQAKKLATGWRPKQAVGDRPGKK